MEKYRNIVEEFEPELVLPSEKFKKSYLETLREYKEVDGDTIDINERDKNFAEFLEKLEKSRQGLIEENCPQTRYWLVQGDKLIGHVSYRPVLNERLKYRGGNIGYAVRPSERGKGWASFMLNKILVKAKADGLSEVILTCDDDNIGSKRVIEKAGGVFVSNATGENVKPFSRYVINLNVV